MIGIPQERVRHTELAILMNQLKEDGCLRIKKYRLLHLVGRQNDADGAWSLVLEAFEDMDGDASQLYYLYLPGSEILIMVGEPKPFN